MSSLDPGVTGRRQHGKPRKTARRQKARAPPEAPLKALLKPPLEAALTMSVPEAGKKYLGLGKNASYKAADQQIIPTIRIGKLRRVPVRAMERLLDQTMPNNNMGKLEAAE